MKTVFLFILLFASTTMANTYNSRCEMTSNDLEHYGKSVAFRLSICQNKESKACELLVETDKYVPETGKKAFNANLYFKFTKAQIDTILKNKHWDEEKARLAFGVVANGTYHSHGNSNLLLFLDHAFRSSKFDSQTSTDDKTGIITTQSCEVIHITY